MVIAGVSILHTDRLIFTSYLPLLFLTNFIHSILISSLQPEKKNYTHSKTAYTYHHLINQHYSFFLSIFSILTTTTTTWLLQLQPQSPFLTPTPLPFPSGHLLLLLKDLSSRRYVPFFLTDAIQIANIGSYRLNYKN